MDNWQIFFACITALLAILAFFLGVNQYRTASAKLRLDLFERRLAVYDAAHAFVFFTQSTDDSRAEGIRAEFHRQRVMARFLFDRNISAYLDVVLRRHDTLQSLRRKWRDRLTEDAELLELLLAEETWMSNQLDVIDEKFTPSLELASWQSTPFISLKNLM